MAWHTLNPAIAAVVLTVACAGPADVRVEAVESDPTPRPSPVVSAQADPEPAPEVDRPAEATAASPAIGAAGAGDSLYPNLGNGGYDVDRYDLVIDFTPDELGGPGVITATATIHARASQDLASFNLDLTGLDVTATTVDGAEAEVRREGSELTVMPVDPLIGGAEFVTVVAYSGAPVPVAVEETSPVNGWTPSTGGIFVAGEPSGASGWFPVNGHPSDKATYRITVTVPDQLDVASNGLLVSSVPNGDGTTTWRYEPAAAMASYLVTLAIDDLTFYEQGTVDGVMLRHAFAREVAAAAQADTVRLPEVLEFFASRFGPFPFDTYGHLVVDTPLGAALETQTLTVFGSDTVAGNGVLTNIVVHELAHQWFGDSVGLADWSDLWLNEGFATYAELLWFEHDGHVSRDGLGPMILDTGAPLPPPGQPDPDNLFAPTVYIRGALTLHAVRLTVGDDAFFAILAQWTERFGGGTATTDDFITLAEEVAAQPLRPLIEEWLYAEEPPELPT